MEWIQRHVFQPFFNKRLGFRVRLFNVLATAGIAISLFSAVACLVNEESLGSVIACLLLAPFSYGLMIYASRSGRYQLCYFITIIVVFFGFFPVIFFQGGGYYGAMPSFFIFAVMFTVFMLEGRAALLLGLLELIIYVGICAYGFAHPQQVIFLPTEETKVMDIITGFVMVSAALGITMYLHFRMYNEQQRQLEKAREEALRHSEVKGMFLANMSHEIRTPINVILGMNEMILQRSSSAEIAEYAQRVESAGNLLLGLINDILDVSRIESGRMAIASQEYQAAELVRELVLIGEESAKKKRLQFTAHIDEALPARLRGDSLHIKRIAVNFLSNAAKYTRQGSVALEVKALPGEAEGWITLRIAVADTGMGIREADLALMFDAFSRLEYPEQSSIEGSGLGLSIAMELTKRMGGQIKVESVWGEGSVFSAEIPQQACGGILGDWRVAGREEEPSPPRYIAPDARILAVDDSEGNLLVIRSLLERTKLRVDTAASGEECCRMVRQKEYHVILMDYMMPEMDGLETLERLRATIPGFSVPVIALTANVIAGTEEKLREAGFVAYLSKPVQAESLEEAIRRTLPEELILPCETGEGLSEENYDQLARELRGYQVELGEALRYVHGDMEQFRRLAGFFVEAQPALAEEWEDCLARGDGEALAHKAHALKSQAGMLGALVLSRSAEALEERCRQNDYEYLRAAWPLLCLQWGRAAKGLAPYVQARLHRESTEPGEENLRRLGEHISAYRHVEALEALDARIRCHPESEESLRAVRALVENLDFEAAEAAFNQYADAERERPV